MYLAIITLRISLLRGLTIIPPVNYPSIRLYITATITALYINGILLEIHYLFIMSLIWSLVIHKTTGTNLNDISFDRLWCHHFTPVFLRDP